MTGWAKIHRSLADHELWLAEPFTYGQAWVDIFLNANHAPGTFMVKRQRVSLERGQLGWSEITMTERWKWSRGKVRRFLKRLSSDGMIEQQAGHLTSIITICNYDDYQSNPKEGGTSDSTADGTALDTPDEHLTVHEAVHKQECKELENGKNGKKTTLPASAATDSEDYRFAEWMLSLITDHQPDFKAPNLTSWANTIRLMRERDKRSHKDMGRVWKWVRLDDFWSPNVMSADKFRKQYDRLVAMTNRPTRSENKQSERERIIEERNRELGIDQPPPGQGDFINGEVTRHD
jgi:hypothetical protein